MSPAAGAAGSAPPVWVVGATTWDETVDVPYVPYPGRFSQGSGLRAGPGGSGANVAVALAAAGTPTALTTCLGSDAIADNLRDHLLGAGLARLHVTRRPGASPRSLVLVEPGGERTIVGVTGDGLAELAGDAGIARAIRAARAVVLPTWRPALAPLAQAARDARIPVVVGLAALTDPDCVADLAIGSHAELRGIDPGAALDRFGAIVVTRGEAGARLLRPGQPELDVPAVPVTCIDATGAGDAFLGWFTAAWLAGQPDAQCLRAGAAAGAAACEQARSAPPHRGRVAALLAAHP